MTMPAAPLPTNIVTDPYPADYTDVFDEPLVHRFQEFPVERWYEYHCLESARSTDADLWYHSQQPCTVLGRLSFEESDHEMYHVRFSDGMIGRAWADEILAGPGEFQCEPPPRPHTVNVTDYTLSPSSDSTGQVLAV